MRSSSTRIALATALLTGMAAWPAQAIDIVKTQTTDGLRIEMHVMQAEPFYTADQVMANPELQGMLIVGGAAPLQPDGTPRPNCHLIVHVYDVKKVPSTDFRI